MIVSRFAIVTEDLWSAVIKSPNLSARGTASPLRLLLGAIVILGPFTDLAISVFREMSMNTVLTQNPHVSWMWAQKMVHEKNWRESLPVMEFHHPPKFP